MNRNDNMMLTNHHRLMMMMNTRNDGISSSPADSLLLLKSQQRRHQQQMMMMTMMINRRLRYMQYAYAQRKRGTSESNPVVTSNESVVSDENDVLDDIPNTATFPTKSLSSQMTVVTPLRKSGKRERNTEHHNDDDTVVISNISVASTTTATTTSSFYQNAFGKLRQANNSFKKICAPIIHNEVKCIKESFNEMVHEMSTIDNDDDETISDLSMS